MAKLSRLSNAISLAGQIAREGQLAWRLMHDHRVPGLFKAIPPLALFYLVLPFDFMPDFVPFLGQADDLAVALLALRLFINLCPRHIKQEHLAAIGRARGT